MRLKRRILLEIFSKQLDPKIPSTTSLPCPPRRCEVYSLEKSKTEVFWTGGTLSTVEAEVLYGKQKNEKFYVLIVETSSPLSHLVLRMLAVRLTTVRQGIGILLFGNMRNSRKAFKMLA